LLVISIPYILGGFLFDYTDLSRRIPAVRKFLYGKTAIILVAILVIAYWILRNI
jgi:hypothetical protein